MKSLHALLIGLFLLAGCQTTRQSGNSVQQSSISFSLLEQSHDPDYGLTVDKPIDVGGFPEAGHRNQYDYIRHLAGPDGERVDARRIGSCCPFPTPRGYEGTGFLDLWEISHAGLAEPLEFYFNSYTYGPPQIPDGFTIVVEGGATRNNLRRSFNEVVLAEARSVDASDGIDREEAVLLAQRYVILSLGRSAEFDLQEAFIGEEGEGEDGSFLVKIPRRSSFADHLEFDGELSEEELQAFLLEQLVNSFPFLFLIVDPEGNVSPMEISVEAGEEASRTREA